MAPMPSQRLLRSQLDAEVAEDFAKRVGRARVREVRRHPEHRGVPLTVPHLPTDLQKSIPTQIRQLTLYISHSEGQVDRFV